MNIKRSLFMLMLLGCVGLLFAQAPQPSPAVANSLYLQWASQGAWEGTSRAGTLTLRDFSSQTHYVVKFDELAGAIYDTTRFNTVWAMTGESVPAVLSLETYNVHLMLSAPRLTGDGAVYEAQITHFIDTTEATRSLENVFGTSSLTLLPSLSFIQALNALDASVRVIPQSDHQFITALYVIPTSNLLYDAGGNKLILGGVSPATQTITDLVSAIDTPALARFWLMIQADRTFALPAMVTFGAESRRLTVFNPVYDPATHTLVYDVMDVQDGVPPVANFASLTILTGPQFSVALAQLAASDRSGTRSDACASAQAEFENANSAYNDLLAQVIGDTPFAPIPATPELTALGERLAVTMAEVNRLCGAQTTQIEPNTDGDAPFEFELPEE